MEEVDFDAIDTLFEKYEEEHGEFERIPEEERLHPDMKLCGFLYLANLMVDPSRFWLGMNASHDELLLPAPDELKATVTEQDAIYLQRCSIHWHPDHETFYVFT